MKGYKGYESLEREVVVDRDNLNLEFFLKPISAKVKIETEPSEVIILVDGKISEGWIEYSEPMSGYTNYYLAHCPEGVFIPVEALVFDVDVEIVSEPVGADVMVGGNLDS